MHSAPRAPRVCAAPPHPTPWHHQAICALLGASAGPSLAPLLAPAAAPPLLLLPHLRVQPPRAWVAAAIAGAPSPNPDSNP